MKPRILRTYKILAVALTATSGCAPITGPSGVGPEPARSEAPVVAIPASSGAAPLTTVQSPPSNALAADAPGANAPGANAPGANAPATAVQAPPEPPNNRPDPPWTSKDPKVNALRSELLHTQPSAALANKGHFRPLCDKDGYPLVGNLMNKGSSASDYQPSAFCSDVRGNR